MGIHHHPDTSRSDLDDPQCRRLVAPLDVYPFILLNLLFSTQAAYAAPIIMMSQNRQSERDRANAEADYKTNLDAKSEIEELQRRLNTIEVDKLDKIIKLLEERR